jgi:hypothetical protein
MYFNFRLKFKTSGCDKIRQTCTQNSFLLNLKFVMQQVTWTAYVRCNIVATRALFFAGTWAGHSSNETEIPPEELNIRGLVGRQTPASC